MKRILLTLIILAIGTVVSAALPVTRPFSGVTGTIPTADETAWAYNRNNAVNFSVAAFDGGSAASGDRFSDTAIHWTGDTFSADHYSEVTLGTTTTASLGSGYGPAVRMDTGTTQKTMYRLIVSTGGWELIKFVNAATTVLASSATPTFTTGDVVRLSISGSTFTMTKNGTPFGSPPTDGTLTTGAAGIAHSSTSSAGDSIASWTGGDVANTRRAVAPILLQ